MHTAFGSYSGRGIEETCGKFLTFEITSEEVSRKEEPGRIQSLGSQSRTQLKQLGIHPHTLFKENCFGENLDDQYLISFKLLP